MKLEGWWKHVARFGIGYAIFTIVDCLTYSGVAIWLFLGAYVKTTTTATLYYWLGPIGWIIALGTILLFYFIGSSILWLVGTLMGAASGEARRMREMRKALKDAERWEKSRKKRKKKP